jgi:hypothetical protein
MFGSAAGDFQKSPMKLSNFCKKNPARMPDFLKKVQQGCHVFVKKSGKVGEDSKKVQRHYRSFEKKKVCEGFGTFHEKVSSGRRTFPLLYNAHKSRPA